MPVLNLLKKGAEANIYRTYGSIIKERIEKKYRIKPLDERLRKERTRAEIKLLERALQISNVNVPRILSHDEFSIEMEFMAGAPLKDAIDANPENCADLCKKIAQSVAAIHNAGIIHGDLTTSNMMASGGKIYLIDFGLGFFSKSAEDMAVDLHLLEESFYSAHSEIAKMAIETVLEEYARAGGRQDVLARLEKLHIRGRYIRK